MNYTQNYLLLCENTILDDKNRITLVNVFDYLSAPQNPIVQGKFSIVGNYWISDIPSNLNSLILVVSLVNGNGEIVGSPLARIEINLKPEEGKQKIGLIVDVANLTFQDFGEYKFTISSENRIIGEAPVIVKIDE